MVSFIKNGAQTTSAAVDATIKISTLFVKPTIIKAVICYFYQIHSPFIVKAHLIKPHFKIYGPGLALFEPCFIKLQN